MINELIIPYPDFKLNDTINPDEFDLNNVAIIDKVDQIVTVLNQITDSIASGGSGADAISLTAIAPFTSTKLQTFLSEVIAKLKSTTPAASGAEFVSSAPITGVTGNTVYAQITSLKALLDAYITSNNGALNTHKTAATLDHPDSSVTTAKIANLAVTNGKLADLSVTAAKIAAGTIDNTRIATDGIVTGNITNLAVTGAKIADGAVSTAKIVDASVTKDKLENGAVIGTKIANGAIGAAHFGAGVIFTGAIADLQVTNAKIAEGAITTSKIAVGAVGNSNLSFGGVGTGAIADGAVNNPKLADNAVTSEKIMNQAVSVSKIAPNSIVTTHINDGVITAAKIVNGVIGTGQLTDGGVTTAKIADGAVTSAKIATGTLDGRYFTETELQSTIFGDDGAARIGISNETGLFAGTVKSQITTLKTLTDAAASSASGVAGALNTHIADDTKHFTTADRTKFSGIAPGAEINQNAFSTISVSGQALISADSKTDTLSIAGGTGITVTTDADTDTVTITATGTATPGAHASSHISGGSDVIPSATTTTAGLLSAGDKVKLNSAIILGSASTTTYYVDAATGNDTTNDGLTSGTAFATITKAISLLPRVINGSYIINVAAGSYSTFILTGFMSSGNGTINIIGDSDNFTKSRILTFPPTLSANSVPVTLQGFKIARTGNTPQLTISGCSNFTLRYFVTDNINTTSVGVSVFNSKALIDRCVMNSKSVAVSAIVQSDVYVTGSTGTGCLKQFNISDASRIVGYSNTFDTQNNTIATGGSYLDAADGGQLTTKEYLFSNTVGNYDYVRSPGFGVTTGTGNAYILTLTPVLFYSVGACISVKINEANTGPATINVNGQGARAIKRSNGSDVAPGFLRLNGIYTMRYDGTAFILQGEGGGGAGSTQYAEYVSAGASNVTTSSGGITFQFDNAIPASSSTAKLLFCMARLGQDASNNYQWSLVPGVFDLYSTSANLAFTGDQQAFGSVVHSGANTMQFLINSGSFTNSGGYHHLTVTLEATAGTITKTGSPTLFDFFFAEYIP